MSDIIEGDVTISISQLDRLRSEKKTAEEENAVLKAAQKQILLTVKVVEDRSPLGYLDYDRDPFMRPWINEQTMKQFQGKKVLAEEVKYINLEDVRDAFKVEAGVAMQRHFDDLGAQFNETKAQLSKERTDKDRAIRDQKVAFEEKLTKQAESHKVIVQEMLNQIAVLEGSEVEKTKDQKIDRLEKRLIELGTQVLVEQQKSWWDKLLGR